MFITQAGRQALHGRAWPCSTAQHSAAQAKREREREAPTLPRPGPERDVRQHLWPQPRSVTLRDVRRGEEHAAGSDVQPGVLPLLVEPDALAFDLAGIPGSPPELRQAAAWSARRLCRRLHRRAREPPGPRGLSRSLLVSLQLDADAAQARTVAGYFDPPTLDADESYNVSY